MPSPRKPALSAGAYVRLKGPNLSAQVTSIVKDDDGNFVEYEVVGKFQNGKEFSCRVSEVEIDVDRLAEVEAKEAAEKAAAEAKAKETAAASAKAAADAKAEATAKAAWEGDAALRKHFPKFEDYFADLAKGARNA